jgi:hypothetical protein
MDGQQAETEFPLQQPFQLSERLTTQLKSILSRSHPSDQSVPLSSAQGNSPKATPL